MSDAFDPTRLSVDEIAHLHRSFQGARGRIHELEVGSQTYLQEIEDLRVVLDKVKADFAAYRKRAELKEEDDRSSAQAVAAAKAAQAAAAKALQAASRVSQNALSPSPRPRLPFPDTFDGSSAVVESWKFQWKSYFALSGTDDEVSRIRLITLRLSGPALDWYRHRMTTMGDFESSDLLLSSLSDAFQPLDASKEARARLATLRQTSTVKSYTAEFRKVALRIPDLSSQETLERYVSGLANNIFAEVYMRDPPTFEEAAKLALRYESIQSIRKTGSRPSLKPAVQPRAAQPPRQADLMDLDALESRSKLSRAERTRLLKAGGCFYCRKPGHFKANCPSRPSSGINAVQDESLNANLQ